MMQYRREIDGLRAVAVMPVLFSHAGFAFFSGGFVGVDIFFVISGYLITKIILGEIEQNRFSIAKFYERRARRILPASFLVMLCTIPAAWLLIGVDGLQNYGQSVVATTLFSNNILLAITSGYWDLESQFKPLLHTWTLGVEEQYYFVVPLFLLLVYRISPAWVRLAIVAIGLLSFALCLWMLGPYPAETFYLLPTRAWELAVGGYIATLRWTVPERSATALSSLGLIMIVASIVSFDETTPFPSAYTLLPVIGSALVLVFATNGPVHMLLATRPMVFIGLISYSVYLWHQPLFAFARIASTEPPTKSVYAALILVTILMAYLSWRFVEAPFRDRSRTSIKTLWLTLTPVAAILVGTGLAMHLSGGFPQRFEQPPNAPPIDEYVRYNSSIHKLSLDAFEPGSTDRWLVLGVSTARDFVNVMKESGRFRDQQFVYREDLDLCSFSTLSPEKQKLVTDATRIVNVYPPEWKSPCDARTLVASAPFGSKLIFVGPVNFGANLNPYSRVPLKERAAVRTNITPAIIALNRRYAEITPPERYIDLIALLPANGIAMPVFDATGLPLSIDRVHLTRAGASYASGRVFDSAAWRRAMSMTGGTPPPR